MSDTNTFIETSEFFVPANDGYKLAATLFKPCSDSVDLNCALHSAISESQSPRISSKALILVAGATGVPQGFYRRFAQAAVEQGFCALTFDYRGIGRSKQGSLKGFKMDYLDWAQKDLHAVLDYARKFELPVYIIGHSYGGHAIGLLPNLQDVQGAWTFGTGAGWHGWMPNAEQWRVKFMWHFLGPIFTRLYGYLAWSRLGMGEDLPLGVYKQWKRWCSFPNYFFDDPQMKGIHEKFERVKFPLFAVNSVDDDWATPASRDAFMSKYRNAQLRLKTIEPDKERQKVIGHMGYFKSHSAHLWQTVFDWIHSHQPELV